MPPSTWFLRVSKGFAQAILNEKGFQAYAAVYTKRTGADGVYTFALVDVKHQRVIPSISESNDTLVLMLCVDEAYE